MNTRTWQLTALVTVLIATVSLVFGAPVAITRGSDPLQEAMAGIYTGTTVTVGGMWQGEQAAGFLKALELFEQKTGIHVEYQTVEEADASLVNSVEAGKGPDIVEFSTPSRLADFVRKGKVVDLASFLDKETLQARYSQNWLDWATMAGPNGPIVAGAWATHYLDSIVWYPKPAFEKEGYQVPFTWQELVALSDQIVKDGGSPWCIENNYTGDDLTGLPAVGWLQDIMLRTSSLEDYDRWTRGELKSSSSQVKHTVQLLSDIWLKPGYAYGERQTINTTGFDELIPRMFDNPPKCWLMKESSALSAHFPEDKVFGQDYAFFMLPPIDRGYGSPMLVDSHIFGMFNDRPEVRALMEYFIGVWPIRSIMAHYSDGLLPQVNQNFYSIAKGCEAQAAMAMAVRNATGLHLWRGSSGIPSEVMHQLQKSLTAYVGGDIDLDTALKQVDAAWPAQLQATKLPSERILFFGDSNTFWVDKYFPKLAASGDPPIQVESKGAMLGGAPLQSHWDRNTVEIDEIRAGKWDVVVLEEDLGDDWPNRATEMPEYARKFYEVINKAGAKMVLFISYPDTTVTSPTTQDIATVLRKSGTELGVKVAPVGLAFQRALQARPDLDLYAKDGDHPSPSGYYLTLVVFYATIFERSPIGLSYRMEDVGPSSEEAMLWSMPQGWTLTDQDALFLQRIAWETVQDYQAGK